MYFQYGDREIAYLKRRDKTLGNIIDQLGHIDRETDSDLFSAVVHHIIGQQISTKAQATIWQRMRTQFGDVDAEHISKAELSLLQSFGMTFRKAAYIQEFARKVCCGDFDLQKIAQLPDKDAVRALASLKGVGVWTAEMILLFCLQRPDIFSFDDLAIQRGLRMVYHHRKIDRRLFEKYRRRFSPYCSVASLYLWAVAGGAIPDMKDFASKQEKAMKLEKAMNSKQNQQQYISHYESPLGPMLLTADDTGLTGLWFEGQRHLPEALEQGADDRELSVFQTARRWLDLYFSGKIPDFTVPLHLIGTAFQKKVWDILCTIPYGHTTTYGWIARQLAAQTGVPRMAAQAVGGAVGRNPISLIVPCHRVIGADGSLTGYGGGIERKEQLLRLEGAAFHDRPAPVPVCSDHRTLPLY